MVLASSCTANDVIIITVNDLDANREYFLSLGFELIEMTESQFMARFNDKVIGVVLQENGKDSEFRQDQRMREAHSEPLGRGIEIWFSVEDIKDHYEQSVEANIDIIVPIGNRGYGPAGDYGTKSPDGFLFFFSQPHSKGGSDDGIPKFDKTI